MTLLLISPLAKRVTISSPSFKRDASVTAFPLFSVILYPRFNNTSGEAALTRCSNNSSRCFSLCKRVCSAPAIRNDKSSRCSSRIKRDCHASSIRLNSRSWRKTSLCKRISTCEGIRETHRSKRSFSRCNISGIV